MLENTFLDWQGEGRFTDVFERLPADARRAIGDAVVLRDRERLAVAVFRANEHWLALTDRRVIWRLAGRTRGLDYGEIADVTPRISIRSGDPVGGLAAVLEVHSVSGARHRVPTEGGRPFVAIWNLLALCAGGAVVGGEPAGTRPEARRSAAAAC